MLIEAVKRELGTETDKGLAEFLGIDPVNIATMRAGKSRLGVVPRLKLYDRFAMVKVRKLIENALPTGIAASLERGVHSIVNAQISSKTYSDGELLELFKSFRNYKSDQEMGNVLGIVRSSVSMVRKGKAKLGIRPKLIILRTLLEDERFHDIQGLDLSEYGFTPDELRSIDFDLIDKVIDDDAELLKVIKPRSQPL